MYIALRRVWLLKIAFVLDPGALMKILVRAVVLVVFLLSRAFVIRVPFLRVGSFVVIHGGGLKG